MKTNSFQDPRLGRAVLGRKRLHFRKVTGVPVNESIEYKILQLRRQLGKEGDFHYQLLFFGEWKNISVEEYRECLRLKMTVRIL